MTNIENLNTLIQTIPALSKMNGGILYSSVETLKEGKFYFLGVNPGGIGSEPLHFDPLYRENAYLDEVWDNGNGTYEKGKAPLQRRVQNLFHALGIDLREVCASNLIFRQSQDIQLLEDFYADADACFPIHQYIIEEIVKPQFIISMGRDVIDYFTNKQNYSFYDEFDSGHSTWKIRIAKKGDITHINVPHMSYYDPFSFSETTKIAKEEALKKLKTIVGS